MKQVPGDRQIEAGKEFKQATGSRPNGVANAWFAANRGKTVVAMLPDEVSIRGQLVAFDAYSLEIAVKNKPGTVLVFKGPGVYVFCDND